MVTVVDAFNFLRDFGTAERLKDRDLTDIEGDYQTIVDLLTDQVEFANVIILNKTDLVEKDQLAVLEAIIKRLNPTASIEHTTFGKISLNSVVGTKLYNEDVAEGSDAWQAELAAGERTPESEEYGISSFVWSSRKPLDSLRFWRFVNRDWPDNVIRSKGLFWLDTRPSQILQWGQAGGSLRTESAGAWWATANIEERMEYPHYVEHRANIEANWDPDFGDRRCELVIIGHNMDEAVLRASFDACVSTEEELASGLWKYPSEDKWPTERVDQVLA